MPPVSPHDTLAAAPDLPPDLPPGLVYPASAAPQAATGDGALAVLPELRLQPGRVHEACGPARRVLAAWVLAAVQRAAGWSGAGSETPPAAIWIRPGWGDARINPHGLADWADPRSLVMVDCPQALDLLWCAEEALRAGSAALVIVDLPDPPELTPVRRLHLAAENGAARAAGAAGAAGATGAAGRHAPPAPLGLLLTPGTGGAPGVESRWQLAPRPAPPQADPALGTAPVWHLDRLRARTAPPARWKVTLGPHGTLHPHRLPETGTEDHAAAAPGKIACSTALTVGAAPGGRSPAPG